MSKLNEIYRQLEVISEEIDIYVDTCENDNISSDIAGKVQNALDTAIFELNVIVDDENAGLYENSEDDGFPEDLEEEEEF
jgi:hypothetical protein